MGDWRAVRQDCPALSFYFVLFMIALVARKLEEWFPDRVSSFLPWTRFSPLFGPCLKRGEVWRFVTFTFFHNQFLDIFQSAMTMMDSLDIEGTPAIVLGDGSNLKCGVGAKQNFVCYPSIGIGTTHTVGLAIVGAAVGGMCSTWFEFRGVVTGAHALGFSLSGGIVALYGLYAGAELDQATSVKRSFQDWVNLRLIFVAFHIAMKCVRAISQRDPTGLFRHCASFAAGFSYVLYFLPPMGDGTMFPSGRPYVVPCNYDAQAYGDMAAPECVRIFTAAYEYELGDVQNKAFMLFAFSFVYTLINTFVFQRNVNSRESVLVQGSEIGAMQWQCCACRKVHEGKDVICWVQVKNALNLPEALRAILFEVRIHNTDPGRLQDVGLVGGGAISKETTPLMVNSPGGEAATPAWEGEENLFLSVRWSRNSFVQIVLRESHGSMPLGYASLPMNEALTAAEFNEMNFNLQAIPGAPAIARPRVKVQFRCLEPHDLRALRLRLQHKAQRKRQALMEVEAQLDAVRRRQDPEIPTRFPPTHH